MLTLTRRVGQRLIIGKDVCIEVVSVSGKQVSIGIEAPDEVRIYREEIAPKEELEKFTMTKSAANK